MTTLDHSIHLIVPFPTPRLANIALRVLNVDKELKTDQARRTLSLEHEKLIVHFDCASTRMLRVSVNSFLEMLVMVTRTMEEFNEEDEEEVGRRIN
ncbi:transcription factor Pcc1-domain-containing protein [Endogone sp. FLAS-F59071]|nr:transcription factor Pcc1-domain-containing protein [Endogone sp. FLAS-F59071]|eukprot:RUS16268.1 transcription factor Pcc1-domain-containing protein [Endogone sp. FLAS-F59071]